jgi:hypothetical protein
MDDGKSYCANIARNITRSNTRISLLLEIGNSQIHHVQNQEEIKQKKLVSKDVPVFQYKLLRVIFTKVIFHVLFRLEEGYYSI